MKADTDAVLGQFGKNEQTKMVFRALFILSKVVRLETEEEPERFFAATAGLVLAEVVDPVTAQAILAAITGA
jgi:hypothetical protein